MRYFGKSCPNANVVLIVVTVVLVAAAAAATHPGTWMAKEDLPAVLYFAATAEVNGIIYAIGGSPGAGVVDTVFAYDPAFDHWTARAPMPTPRSMAVAAVVDGKIYVIGGILDTSEWTVTGAVEVYDPSTDTWVTRNLADHIDASSIPKSLTIDIGPRSMPKALWSPAVAVVDGKIFVVGGATGDGLGEPINFSTVQVYDPADNSWDTGTDMPTARRILSASVVDGLIYAAGGYATHTSSALEVYDPATDAWSIAADMPRARGSHAAAIVDGMVYVFGGLTSDGLIQEVGVYDASKDSWEHATRMADQRWGLGAAVVNGEVHLIGGGLTLYLTGSRFVDTYDPNLYTYWTEVAAHLPGAFGSQWRTDMCVANINDEEADLELVLHTDVREFTHSDEIGPRQQKAFEDVVGTMGIEEKGMLEVRSDQFLRMAGRIFSEDDGGTFGQFCDFLTMDEGFFKGDMEVYLVGLRQEEGLFRTNLIFANTGIREATVFVTLHRCSGEALRTFHVSLDPGQLDQRLEVFANEGGEPNVGWGFARMMVIEGAGVRISASVIDSRTNDATTIVAER